MKVVRIYSYLAKIIKSLELYVYTPSLNHNLIIEVYSSIVELVHNKMHYRSNIIRYYLGNLNYVVVMILIPLNVTLRGYV